MKKTLHALGFIEIAPDRRVFWTKPGPQVLFEEAAAESNADEHKEI